MRLQLHRSLRRILLLSLPFFFVMHITFEKERKPDGRLLQELPLPSPIPYPVGLGVF